MSKTNMTVSNPKQPALLAAHCDVLNQPFYQFSQMKQFAPESIDWVKTQYKAAWQDWRDFVLALQAALLAHGVDCAEPHIERWCNGWQVRAHFFAFFKLRGFEQDAPILSLILNRQRLMVSLDWHAYKAAKSRIPLSQYHAWLAQLDRDVWQDWHLWCGKDSEYAEHRCVQQWQPAPRQWQAHSDFYRIGKYLSREELAQHDTFAWALARLDDLLPLYRLSCPNE